MLCEVSGQSISSMADEGLAMHALRRFFFMYKHDAAVPLNLHIHDSSSTTK